MRKANQGMRAPPDCQSIPNRAHNRIEHIASLLVGVKLTREATLRVAGARERPD